MALVLVDCIHLLHRLTVAAAVVAVARLRLAAPPWRRWGWQWAHPSGVAAAVGQAVVPVHRLHGGYRPLRGPRPTLYHNKARNKALECQWAAVWRREQTRRLPGQHQVTVPCS